MIHRPYIIIAYIKEKGGRGGSGEGGDMRKPMETSSHYHWFAAFVGSESLVKTISLFFTLVRNHKRY